MEWFKIEGADGSVRMLKMSCRKSAQSYARPGEKVWSSWDDRWHELPSPWPAYAFYAN